MKNYGTFFGVVIVVLLCRAGLFFLRKPASVSSDNQETLVVGMMSGWAPFMTINANGDYEGFDVDVAQEIGRRMNRPVIVEDLGSLASCFIALDQGRIDMLLSGLDITKKRLENVAMIRYTGEDIRHFSLVFWDSIPEGIQSMQDLRQFSNAVVSAESGSAQEKFLDSYDFVIKKPMNSVMDIVLDLRFGKSLAAILEPRVAARLQRQNAEIKKISVDLPQDFHVFGCGITLKKDAIDLIAMTELIVEQMYTDGTLKKLEQKWQLEE